MGYELDAEDYRPQNAAIELALEKYFSLLKVEPVHRFEAIVETLKEVPNGENEACELVATQLKKVTALK